MSKWGSSPKPGNWKQVGAWEQKRNGQAKHEHRYVASETERAMMDEAASHLLGPENGRDLTQLSRGSGQGRESIADFSKVEGWLLAGRCWEWCVSGVCLLTALFSKPWPHLPVRQLPLEISQQWPGSRFFSDRPSHIRAEDYTENMQKLWIMIDVLNVLLIFVFSPKILDYLCKN